MRVEVDQSGRIEFTKEDTVLAFSNSVSFSIFIPSTVKRKCITTLRRRNISGPSLYTHLFATGLYLLLQYHIEYITQVVIDVEFLGKDAEIKRHLLNLLRRTGHTVEPDQIQFTHIGKQSLAHHLALETLRRKMKPNLIITLRDMLKEF